MGTLWTAVHEARSDYARWSEEQAEPKPAIAGPLLVRDLMREQRAD